MLVDSKNFLNKKINEDWNTSWENFSNLFSVLRHVVVHNGMRISIDVKNELLSSGGDAFKHYFVLNSDKPQFLKAKDLHSFLRFAEQMNDFVANTVRLIAGESTLNFIGFSPV